MWKLFSAELRYSLALIIFTVGFILFFALLYISAKVDAKPWHIPLFSLATAVTLQLFIIRSIEKRNRQQILLPLSTRARALGRLLLVILPCAFFYGLYFLAYAIALALKVAWPHDMMDMLMFMGVIFIGFSIYLFLHDLYGTALRTRSTADYDIPVMVLVFLFVMLGGPLALAYVKPPNILLLQFCWFVSGVLLMGATIWSYERRWSYLE